MESDYYYEPTIKTSRNTTRNTNYYQLDYANELIKLNVEKQQLIKFLEENIRNRLDTVKFYNSEDVQYTMEELEKIVSREVAELNAYQEVLDFVRGDMK